MLEIWDKVLLVIGECPENNELQLCVRSYFETIGHIVMTAVTCPADLKSDKNLTTLVNSLSWFFECVKKFRSEKNLDWEGLNALFHGHSETGGLLVLNHLKATSKEFDFQEFEHFLLENEDNAAMLLEVQSLFVAFKG